LQKEKFYFLTNVEFINFANNQLEIKINCSKGTYIRALARYIGQKLNTGGHLKLERSQIGNFTLNDTITLDEFEKIIIQNTQ